MIHEKNCTAISTSNVKFLFKLASLCSRPDESVPGQIGVDATKRMSNQTH